MSGHVHDLLSAFLDGELSAPERDAVDAHLEACPACAARLAELALVDEAARELPAEAPPGYFEDFPARVRARLRLKPEARPARAVPRWAWAAAAALLLAVLTPLTLHERPALLREPPPPSAPAAAEPEREAPGAAGRFAPPAGRASERAEQPGPLPAAPKVAAPEAVRDGATRDSAAAQSAPVAAQAKGTTGGGPGALAAAPGKGSPATPEATPLESRRDRAEEAKPAAAPPLPASTPGYVRAPESVNGSGERIRAAARPNKREAEPPAEVDALREAEARPAAAAAEPAQPRPARGVATERLLTADEEYKALRARRATTAGEARALRDDWRGFAARNPGGARGDEARLQVLEAGLVTLRLGHDPRDRETLRRDAQTYLARPDAAQAARARALLDEAEHWSVR